MNKLYFTILFENKWKQVEIFVDDPIVKNFLTISREDTIITPKVSDFIRTYKGEILPNIIDIECLIRQLDGKGKDLLTPNVKRWSYLRTLRDRGFIDSNFKLNEENLDEFITISINYLEILFKCSDNIEKNRLFDIEVPTNQIIYNREFIGLNYNNVEIPKLSRELEEKIYKRKNILQLDFNIFNPDDRSQQLKYINSKNYKLINESIYRTFKRHQYNDAVCHLFYELLKYQKDLETFIFIASHWGGKNKCFPSYLGFGTITSRITMREPSIQNLRREARKVIIPENGKKFLYIDYSQFEAGILAALSNDKNLINLFNEGSIYSSLGDTLYPTEEDLNLKRDKSKEDFYAYVYSDEVNQKYKEYFSKFPALEEYKQSLKDEILENHKIGSDFGNFRFLGKIEECNWYLSHKIQSTASLIYKKALLKVYSEVPEVEFLVPMHDGTLYQLPDNNNYSVLKDKIEQIYIKVFKDFFPSIGLAPKVKIKENFE